MLIVKHIPFLPAIGVVASLVIGNSQAHAFPSGGHLAAPFNGSAFSSSCTGVGLGYGFGEDVGNDLTTFGITDENSSPMTCSSNVSTGTANSSHAYSPANVGNLGGRFNGSASGSAQAGVVQIQAANNANMTQGFTGAAANGGWNDSYTVGGGSGLGLWVIPIHVSGVINTPSTGTAGIFQIVPYVNNQTISSEPPHSAAAFLQYTTINQVANGNVSFVPSFEVSSYGAINWGPGDSQSTVQLTVNEIVNLVIPITYNAPVDLGIYGSVVIGERAQGAATGPADIQFRNTIAWIGPGYVLDWNFQNGITGQNDNITVSAASGVDYTQSFLTTVPEPATLVLFGLGLAGLGLSARRRD